MTDIAASTPRSRTVTEVTFAQPIRIIGTSTRQDTFSAADGWVIEVHDYGVTLSKPATQNVAEVPAFSWLGTGFAVPDDPRERQIRALLDAAIISPEDARLMRAGAIPREQMEKMLADMLADMPDLTAETGRHSGSAVEGVGGGTGIISEAALSNETLNAEDVFASAGIASTQGLVGDAAGAAIGAVSTLGRRRRSRTPGTP